MTSATEEVGNDRIDNSCSRRKRVFGILWPKVFQKEYIEDFIVLNLKRIDVLDIHDFFHSY